VVDHKGDVPSARETARALNSGAIHLLRSMRRVDRLAGLTPARLSALSVLVFAGPCSLGRLARAEDVAGPTMTRIVDGLEAAGLALRTEHPDSARSVLISATEKGAQLMHEAADRRIEAIMSALQQMPARDRERIRAAAPALVELAEVVRGSEAGADGAPR
jgi:DNA-binding MarR family transcriptional regulator